MLQYGSRDCPEAVEEAKKGFVMTMLAGRDEGLENEMPGEDDALQPLGPDGGSQRCLP